VLFISLFQLLECHWHCFCSKQLLKVFLFFVSVARQAQFFGSFTRPRKSTLGHPQKYSQLRIFPDSIRIFTVDICWLIDLIVRKLIVVHYEQLADACLLCCQLLLSMLVNKLGDPSYKVAASTAHLLTKLGYVSYLLTTRWCLFRIYSKLVWTRRLQECLFIFSRLFRLGYFDCLFECM